jgi:aminoglycoside 3-N-acetyltransferase I
MSSPKFFSIRQLQRNDVALMNAMMVMFADSFGDVDTYTGALPSKNYLERLLGSKQFIALAALAEKTVVGGLTAYELQKYEQERSEIYIYDLAVAADYRRQGIATALMTELKAIAVSRGVYVIFVQADLPDIPARSLYAKLGKCTEVLHFDIEVARD